MKTLTWDRREVIAGLRQDIWRYLTEAARNDDDVVLFAAALLQMPPAEVRSLAQLQFIGRDVAISRSGPRTEVDLIIADHRWNVGQGPFDETFKIQLFGLDGDRRFTMAPGEQINGAQASDRIANQDT